MWQYKELVSCPLTLVLGEFEHREIGGYVTLPISNLRLSILVHREGGIRIVSNIPFREWVNHLREVCYATYTGTIDKLNLLGRVEAISMFYGGLGVYGVLGDQVVPMSLDFVNKQRFYFYIAPLVPSKGYEKASLGDWVLLQLALREGLEDILLATCRYVAKSNPDSCVIRTSHGELVISRRELRANNYIRIFPENVPLRHVVAVDR